MAEVSLRAVEDADLPLFFAWMSDPDATRVAAFTRRTPPTAPRSTPTGRGSGPGPAGW
ncbi:hypothetical protein GA0115280_116289 [Streptomyces sp. Cmuel-A718b]|nr:hypothetical protein GA0115280_116289 [Streptomyces sp. Cmuel-A718b]